MVQDVNVRVFDGSGMINSVGPIAYLGGTEIIATGNQRVCKPISVRPRSHWETELIRVSGSGYVK